MPVDEDNIRILFTGAVRGSATHKPDPPYGLPPYLFRFKLELASAPHCILLLMIARSFLVLKKAKWVGNLPQRLENQLR